MSLEEGVTRQSVPRFVFPGVAEKRSVLTCSAGITVLPPGHSWRGFVQFAPGAVSSLPPFSPPHFAASSCFFFLTISGQNYKQDFADRACVLPKQGAESMRTAI
ncbi:uncharacterized protein RHO17_015375 [Thomomys bottae]